MMTIEEYKRILSNFKKNSAKKFGILKIGIFGSVARGENTNDSDIDIIVDVTDPSLSLMYNLKEELRKLFKRDVDLVRERKSLNKNFVSNINKDVIYV